MTFGEVTLGVILSASDGAAVAGAGQSSIISTFTSTFSTLSGVSTCSLAAEKGSSFSARDADGEDRAIDLRDDLEGLWL